MVTLTAASYGRKSLSVAAAMLLSLTAITARPLSAETASFGRNSIFRLFSFHRKALFRPQLTPSAAILLRPKVSVTAAIGLALATVLRLRP